jgi:1,4-alpha-glucan branching enzyme
MKKSLLLATSGAAVVAASCGLGPTPGSDGVVFGLWAPHATAVNVVHTSQGDGGWNSVAMASEDQVWCASVSAAKPGDGYRFQITPGPPGTAPIWRPDPRSRIVVPANVTSGATYDGATYGGAVAYSVVHDPDFQWSGAGDDDVQVAAVESESSSSSSSSSPRFLKSSPRSSSSTPGALVLDVATLVIYEMHVQSFTTLPDGSPGTLRSAIAKVPYLQSLGISAVELLPVSFFPGPAAGWGYNPSVPFAVHPALGGYDALREFVRACNLAGIGVIMDVVLNHFDPGNALVEFDGWAGPAGTGIYFFQGLKKTTPWGPRPDYAEPQVTAYLSDWLTTMVTECGVSGFRWDSTVCMRLGGDPSVPCWSSPKDIPSGWKMFQAGNSAVQSIPGGARFTVAEDTKNFFDVTLPVDDGSAGVPGAPGGGGFTRQWGEMWYFSFEPQLVMVDNADINVAAVAGLLANADGAEDPHRVVYTENHDKASNQQTGRIPAKVDPGGSAADASYWALKKAAMGISAMMISVGTPMLFYGQELVEYRAFTFPVPPPFNWSLTETNAGFVKLVSDIVAVRRDATTALACPDATAKGSVLSVNDDAEHKVAVIFRFCDSGESTMAEKKHGGTRSMRRARTAIARGRTLSQSASPAGTLAMLRPVIAVINLDRFNHTAFQVSNVPVDGTYNVAFNGDSKKYSSLYSGFGSEQTSVEISNGQGSVMVPPFSAVILVHE